MIGTLLVLGVFVFVVLPLWGHFAANKPYDKASEAWHHHNEQARLHPTLYRNVAPPPAPRSTGY